MVLLVTSSARFSCDIYQIATSTLRPLAISNHGDCLSQTQSTRTRSTCGGHVDADPPPLTKKTKGGTPAKRSHTPSSMESHPNVAPRPTVLNNASAYDDIFCHPSVPEADRVPLDRSCGRKAAAARIPNFAAFWRRRLFAWSFHRRAADVGLAGGLESNPETN